MATKLFDKTIAGTAEQAAEFSHLLGDTGAEVLSFPTIQIAPPSSWTAADKAIRNEEKSVAVAPSALVSDV